MANLSDDLKQALCPRPCEHVAHTEVELVDGTLTLVKGVPPPPLCDSCPHRDSEAPPIRYVKVRRNAYATPEAGPVAEPVAVLPAVPVAEAEPEPEDPIVAMQRRYLAQMAEDDRAAGVRNTAPGVGVRPAGPPGETPLYGP